MTPLSDYIFATWVFNLAKQIGGQSRLLVEIQDLDDDGFCLEQLMTIAKSEARLVINGFLKHQIYATHPAGASVLRESFKSYLSRDIGPNEVVVIIIKKKPIHQLLYVVDHYIQIASDGDILVLKNRRGSTSDQPIPWEQFNELCCVG